MKGDAGGFELSAGMALPGTSCGSGKCDSSGDRIEFDSDIESEDEKCILQNNYYTHNMLYQ